MALFALLVMFLVSADSYTHDFYDHFDSATFFTSGKAWMNGMVPYVDFSDSKGPLLWFIYGVGYLLTPRSYVGVFWITVIVYAYIFFWLAKTALIYLGNRRKAMMAAMLTALSIYFPLVRYETRAEDFCLFFFVWSLYHVCNRLHGTGATDGQSLKKTAWVLGVSMAATLLIKYNVTVMIGVMALLVLHASWKTGDGVWKPMGHIVLAFTITLAPMVAYMLAGGWFFDFIREYFIVTMDVVKNQHEIMRHPVYLLWANRWTVGIILCVNAISAWAVTRYAQRYRWAVATIFLVTFFLIVSNAFWLYYYAMCSTFVLFGWVAVFLLLGKNTLSRRWHVAAVAVVTIVTVTAMHALRDDESWFFRDNAERATLYRYAAIMSQVKHPTIVYYNTCTSGFGVPVESLPGCKYWTSQSGATTRMDDDQRQAIESRRTDFVITMKDYDDPAWLRAQGYHLYDHDSRLTMRLYSRDSLPEPPANFYVTNQDVLLKRNLLKP